MEEKKSKAGRPKSGVNTKTIGLTLSFENIAFLEPLLKQRKRSTFANDAITEKIERDKLNNNG